MGREVEGPVTKNEFYQYYRNISSFIKSDDYYALMLQQTWNLDSGDVVLSNSNSNNSRNFVNKIRAVTTSKGPTKSRLSSVELEDLAKRRKTHCFKFNHAMIMLKQEYCTKACNSGLILLAWR